MNGGGNRRNISPSLRSSNPKRLKKLASESEQLSLMESVPGIQLVQDKNLEKHAYASKRHPKITRMAPNFEHHKHKTKESSGKSRKVSQNLIPEDENTAGNKLNEDEKDGLELAIKKFVKAWTVLDSPKRNFTETDRTCEEDVVREEVDVRVVLPHDRDDDDDDDDDVDSRIPSLEEMTEEEEDTNVSCLEGGDSFDQYYETEADTTDAVDNFDHDTRIIMNHSKSYEEVNLPEVLFVDDSVTPSEQEQAEIDISHAVSDILSNCQQSEIEEDIGRAVVMHECITKLVRKSRFDIYVPPPLRNLDTEYSSSRRDSSGLELLSNYADVSCSSSDDEHNGKEGASTECHPSCVESNSPPSQQSTVRRSVESNSSPSQQSTVRRCVLPPQTIHTTTSQNGDSLSNQLADQVADLSSDGTSLLTGGTNAVINRWVDRKDGNSGKVPISQSTFNTSRASKSACSRNIVYEAGDETFTPKREIISDQAVSTQSTYNIDTSENWEREASYSFHSRPGKDSRGSHKFYMHPRSILVPHGNRQVTPPQTTSLNRVCSTISVTDQSPPEPRYIPSPTTRVNNPIIQSSPRHMYRPYRFMTPPPRIRMSFGPSRPVRLSAVRNVSPSTVRNMSPSNFRNMSPSAIRNRSPSTIRNISPSAVRNIPLPPAMRNTSPVRNMSPSVVNRYMSPPANFVTPHYDVTIPHRWEDPTSRCPLSAWNEEDWGKNNVTIPKWDDNVLEEEFDWSDGVSVGQKVTKFKIDAEVTVTRDTGITSPSTTFTPKYDFFQAMIGKGGNYETDNTDNPYADPPGTLPWRRRSNHEVSSSKGGSYENTDNTDPYADPQGSLPWRRRSNHEESTRWPDNKQSNEYEDQTPPGSPYWKRTFVSLYHHNDIPYIDTHCHIDFLFNRTGFQGTFTKFMVENNDTFPHSFQGCLANFCDPKTFNPKGGLWKDVLQEPLVWGAFGCHPKNAAEYSIFIEDNLRKIMEHKKVIALGEIGLDYSGIFEQQATVQKFTFIRQLRIALEFNKPLVIHLRNAEEDGFEIIKENVPKNYKIHRHCFTKDWEEAKKWISYFPNLYIGLTPLVTYKSAWETHQVARYIPLDRLILETDAPYFVPYGIPKSDMPHSHPGLAICVAKEVARLRNVSMETVLKACRENTRNMYGI